MSVGKELKAKAIYKIATDTRGMVSINNDDHPHTFQFILDNKNELPKTLHQVMSGDYATDWYFPEKDFFIFADELALQSSALRAQLIGINMYLKDNVTLAFKICKLM